MQTGICHLSLVPVRAEPSDRSEMVTQLLFGDRWTLLGEEEKWLRIRIDQDDYEGWIDRNQGHFCEPATEPEDAAYALEIVQAATGPQQHINLVLGSRLAHFDGMNFRNDREKMVYNGQTTQVNQGLKPEFLPKMALKYLGCPYLWGGKSPFGIDCSGFVQILYRLAGISLPRDAGDQAGSGESVDFAHMAHANDLAFFENEEGRIIHVGMMLDSTRIIHASGQVRIDQLDHHGIYNQQTGRYSHKLRIIKRHF
jgi:hypothetical protein